MRDVINYPKYKWTYPGQTEKYIQKMKGQKFIGFELNPEWVKLAEKEKKRKQKSSKD